MEWWRKLAIVIALLSYAFCIVGNCVLLSIDPTFGLIDFTLYSIALGMIFLYLYHGQFEGWDHLNSKLTKVLTIVCFPGLIGIYFISYVVGWFVIIETKMKRRNNGKL